MVPTTRFLSLAILIITCNSFGQATPCEDWECDSMAIRAIYDSRGDTLQRVTEIAYRNSAYRNEEGRIFKLEMQEVGDLPPEIGKLSQLERLIIHSTQLTTLPPEIGQLSKLTLLILRADLISLPPEIGQLSQLEWWDLLGTQLTSLPPEIGQLSQLKHWDLAGDQLTSLPPTIGQLSQLEYFAIHGCPLTSLPSEIGQLSNLDRFTIGGKLTTLPPTIGQLSQLTYLDIRGELTSVPPEIGQLSRLSRLDLYENQLTSLPPEIGQLSQLEYLDLHGNQLTSLPPTIGQLTSLTDLRLHDNQLTALPPEISTVPLTRLSLYGNQLTNIPPEMIVHMQELDTTIFLSLSGNHLTSLPPEIINLKIQDLYYMAPCIYMHYNYLCQLPDSIEAWLDTAACDGWRETQKLNDSTPCGGTDIQLSVATPPEREMTIRHQPSSNLLTIGFTVSSAIKDVSIYTLKGRLVKKLRTVRNSITLDTQVYNGGVFCIRVVVDGKSFVRMMLL